MIVSNGGLCAGALIEPDVILTAAHCVNKLWAIHVSWIDNPQITEPAQIIGINSKADVALIRLEKPAKDRKPLPLLAKGQKLPEGSAIATVGHPSVGVFFANPPFDMDMTYLMSTGVISGLTQDEIISDMSVSPGNSGGPVLDERGEVIGVVSRKRVDRFVGAIGFSAGLTHVYELLENYHAGKFQTPRFRNAATSGKVYLAYSSQTFTDQYADRTIWYAGVIVDAWDRVRFELADNFNRKRGFQDYALGYKFGVEMFNHNMIYITPTVDFLHYQVQQNDVDVLDKRVTGYGLSLMASSLPLGFKYIGFNLDGKYYGIASLQLAF